jgi:hypothetical protein
MKHLGASEKEKHKVLSRRDRGVAETPWLSGNKLASFESTYKAWSADFMRYVAANLVETERGLRTMSDRVAHDPRMLAQCQHGALRARRLVQKATRSSRRKTTGFWLSEAPGSSSHSNSALVLS